MRNAVTLAIVCALAWTSTVRAEVRLTMADGQVSLSAKNATAAQILAEWARVGQTRIVNGERIPGAPMTIELTNVPEAQALDIILRSASGYLLAPRSNAIPSASRFDRILIVPASTATGAVGAPSPPVPVTALQQPRFNPQPPQLDDFEPDDPDSAGAAAGRGPIFNPLPPPNGVVTPGDQDDPAAHSPGAAPAGVARPGMLVPTPKPAQQPGARLGSPQQ